VNEAVAHYWSFARARLGITSAEFWTLTPRELQWLIDAWDDGQRAEDRRTATICMVLANCNRSAEHKPTPFTVADFMPVRVGEERAPVEQNWETQKAIFGAVAEAAKRSTPT
jgi:hypothetical protein